MLLSRRPGLPLTPYVECIWHYESGAPLEGRDRVLPDGRFHLMLNLDAGVAAVAGLRSHHVVVDRARMFSVMGVVFRPGAARAFFAAPAVDFRDRAVRLDLVWGLESEAQLLDQLREARAAEARLRIVESALIERMQRFGQKHLEIHPGLHYALQTFQSAHEMRTVAEVSREIGWSRRWFSHAFAEHVGMTPKRYCRLVRFQHLVRQVASQESVDWADLALAGGFCDQAHLIHEFRAFSGFSPECFLTCERPYRNHVRVA
ncbi:MAG: AraC family transcriptional regulator [Acidobacteria bacterium]|nr:AraC family transcriptional regulator [Acidobacteriota bacterium]